MIVLARSEGTYTPLGQDFVYLTKMAKTTLNQTFNFLEQKDYIFKDESGLFRVLDPLIKYALKKDYNP